MLRKVLVIIVLASISFFCISGCGGDDESDEVVVKTDAEYEAEAEAQINEENMAEELAKIEKALEQELSEEP
jgi:ABC-type phosphate/phosphonate transport system substrate-binding protein